jgi:hypothetical protein
MKSSVNSVILNRFKAVLAVSFCALGVARSHATSIIYETPIQVQSVTLSLKATLQSGVTTNTSRSRSSVNTNTISVAITTKDVIAALGRAFSTNFSHQAKLLRITGQDGSQYFAVQDPMTPGGDTHLFVSSTNTTVLVGFNVSSNLQRQVLESVTMSTTSRGTTAGTSSSSDNFTLRVGSTLTGNLRGFTTSNIATWALTSQVIGNGTLTNAPCLLQGTLSFSAKQAQNAVYVVGPPTSSLPN